MEIKSVNIFGVTGGIGSSFLKLASDKNIRINGFYNQDSEVANSIRKKLPNVQLTQVDLSDQFGLDNVEIPNSEGLLFVAGEPHFSKDIFDFELPQLRTQININLFSFLALIKTALKYEECELKKIVFVSSELPTEVNSIYHLSKILQEKTFEILANELNKRNISVSIVKAGWVNTKMYNKYIAMYGLTQTKVFLPESVAQTCLREFSNSKPFNFISV